MVLLIASPFNKSESVGKGERSMAIRIRGGERETGVVLEGEFHGAKKALVGKINRHALTPYSAVASQNDATVQVAAKCDCDCDCDGRRLGRVDGSRAVLEFRVFSGGITGAKVAGTEGQLSVGRQVQTTYQYLTWKARVKWKFKARDLRRSRVTFVAGSRVNNTISILTSIVNPPLSQPPRHCLDLVFSSLAISPKRLRSRDVFHIVFFQKFVVSVALRQLCLYLNVYSMSDVLRRKTRTQYDTPP
ncbi:uncharacterized protein CLUP02_08559 [Colletotrichum lupini]|uniref:Uncharacterized protein n=1 Tax=Colletotrichum lupini TaxID=145971 RepID=A0A9Q8STB4_9PEZI|nr:uncharacterized protein CLUP02_08559 [Colletotrichum lupini]UQC83068.1 hypothetical protein CLUP02_08559 [Colletotrichum lupini]